ncbi:hypothetical protein MIND_01227000 [Mycena indigotica]|uniref:Uncharacterized protein n=1 Tax=Mycena indigotica TaxID=2126181 RepID=A0A8H6S470_9AGAR|nr:uncharacterized protein MIND_01227000 [Mycena indigotica]KAF7292013.1 hypothetical protein MIND_01227000 [Mycena indigotica]
MAPSTRKQTTYAHKRNRAKAISAVSASSPLPDAVNDDEDHYLTHAELSSRLKRSRRSSNPELPLSKRLRSSQVLSLSVPSPNPTLPTSSAFETPHPSVLTEEQKFKLKSSRPVNPDEVSPFVPPPRTLHSRTSSRNHKENATTRRTNNKSKFLDSPFNSRPGSAAVSPQKTISSPEKQTFKRTLSDTNYNPNVQQSASTANSPTHNHNRLRRPSAPSPPRPADWLHHDYMLSNLDIELHNAFSNPFFFPTDVDFNRPPSSLSMYGDCEHFFDDVQGESTPARTYRAPPPNFDTDEDVFDDVMDVDPTTSTGPKLRDIPRERSPWLSDSLISPPNSQEWNKSPRYTQSPAKDHDFDMEDEFSLNLSEEPLGQAFNDAPPAVELKHMFDGLAIVQGSNKGGLSNRTRSLDSAPEPTSTDNKPKGRDRRGTIRASDFVKVPIAPARRTRSGTVIGPPATRARSLDRDNTADSSLGEVDEGEELDGWCAEDWAVAAPPSPVHIRKPRSQRRVSLSQPMISMDELDFLSGGSGLITSPVTFKKPSIKGKEKAVMEEDEEDDELLLKPGMHWEF